MTIYDTYDRIEIEITSNCNARCSGCSRTLNGETNPQLTVADLTVEDFTARVPAEALHKKSIEFCGVFGDAIMHKNLIPIIEYINSTKPLRVSIDTNGGVQKPEFWKKLAELGVKVTFSVDGHRETNHLYRVNTNFDIILRNMKAYADAGGWGNWEYIAFDHNEHEIEAARLEAERLNFDFNVRRNSRNTHEGYKSVAKVKENGKVVKKEIEIKQTSKEYQHSQVKETEFELNDEAVQKLVDIKCLYYHDRKLYLGFDGRLWPCCYFGDLYNGQGNPQIIGKDANKYEFLSFEKIRKLDKKYGVGWNSILNHSWEEILGHEYYNKVLPGTFNSTGSNFSTDNVVPKCALKCRKGGSIREVERQFFNKPEENTYEKDYIFDKNMYDK